MNRKRYYDAITAKVRKLSAECGNDIIVMPEKGAGCMRSLTVGVYLYACSQYKVYTFREGMNENEMKDMYSAIARRVNYSMITA